jgi:hypothetical protein
MKKSMFVLVAFLTMVIFVGGVMAQTTPKPADKPAAPTAEKPKTAEPKAEIKEVSKGMEVMGTVAAYEAGKMIKVKEKDKETAFDVTGDTKINGEVKEGAKVSVMYKKDGGKTVAIAITVAAEKKSEKKN